MAENDTDFSILDYEVTEPDPENEATPAPKYEIFSYPADTTLKGYLEQWTNEQLWIPPFQRGYVWDQTRASKLIESFLLGLPVPPVFLYKPAGSKQFWIVDGQQRIHSVVDFQRGIFGESRFRLKGVDARWEGKTFADLGETDRFNLETAVLRAIVIQQTHPADHSSIYHIFERLNTGGIRLNAMEVRQCVFSSEFLNELKVVNGLQDWQKILGTTKSDKRLKDVELVLRVIALYRDFENYDKPMKQFLNKCAAHFRAGEAPENLKIMAEREEVFRRFSDACSLVVQEIGERPFHLRGRLNFSALDAVMVAVMRNATVSDLADKFKKLLATEAFMEDVSYNTSDEAVLQRRMKLANELIC
ncbi:DUF262 domain-containing protein [Novosphingobium sp. UBA1939]|uniref:DUF262 domain-containing protein n=1 Tax=Novosphingobium sp. UBA1939 TaxID=1946982 RepID=UPI0025ED8F02|nr:DUF262 domain-containing protein [Novosphingobium sp. UBA1939]